ncbi:MAG: F0F1 ATP synthase subunit A, partial [Planctomycetaceae bacterium]|nr:F0F1 ATP synthase subunit A [Planctomycetaceae bacterium]
MSAEHNNDVFHHIRDALHFEIPKFLDSTGASPQLPNIMGFQVTKFMVLEVVAGLLTLFIFWGLARHIRKGSPARGKFWNFWEAIALFIRDNVVRDAIGEGHHHDHDGDHGDHGHESYHHGDHAHTPVAASQKLNSEDFGVTRVGHPADQFAPFVLTVFFFILFCNLLGAIPWLGSPTGHLSVTGILAMSVFVRVVLAGSSELGVVGFWKALAPKMDLPAIMAALIIPMIWGIEVIGLLIKHGVL